MPDPPLRRRPGTSQYTGKTRAGRDVFADPRGRVWTITNPDTALKYDGFDRYLDPAIGIATTPDAPDLTITGDVRFTAKVRDDSAEAATSRYVFDRRGNSSTTLAYGGLATFSTNNFMLGWPTGTPSPQVGPSLLRTAFGLTPPGVDRYVGWSLRGVNPASSAVTLTVAGLTSSNGTTWASIGSGLIRADGYSFESNSILRIGLAYIGRIYWVQAESLDGAGNPTGIIWRFDAEEYPFDPPVGPVVTFPPTTQPVDTSQIQSPSFEPLLEYRYSMYETLSGDFVDEMPVTYSNYGKVLNAPGAGEIHLPIRAMKGSFAEALGRPFQEKMTSNSFEEYTHCIAIVRNDACVWSGFLGRTRVSSADRRVSIALIGYWDYFRNRLIRQRMDLAGQNAFTAVRQLIDHCQDEYGIASDLGVLTGSGLAPFFTDQVINTYDFRYYGDVIEDMAKSDDHFEFSIDTQFDTSELLTKTLKLGAPTLGRRVEYVLEWGKNMYVYNYERDGDQRRNQMWGVGAGEGDNLVIARAIDNPSLGRFPIRDG